MGASASPNSQLNGSGQKRSYPEIVSPAKVATHLSGSSLSVPVVMNAPGLPGSVVGNTAGGKVDSARPTPGKKPRINGNVVGVTSLIAQQQQCNQAANKSSIIAESKQSHGSFDLEDKISALPSLGDHHLVNALHFRAVEGKSTIVTSTPPTGVLPPGIQTVVALPPNLTKTNSVHGTLLPKSSLLHHSPPVQGGATSVQQLSATSASLGAQVLTNIPLQIQQQMEGKSGPGSASALVNGGLGPQTSVYVKLPTGQNVMLPTMAMTNSASAAAVHQPTTTIHTVDGVPYIFNGVSVSGPKDQTVLPVQNSIRMLVNNSISGVPVTSVSTTSVAPSILSVGSNVVSAAAVSGGQHSGPEIVISNLSSQDAIPQCDALSTFAEIALQQANLK